MRKQKNENRVSWATGANLCQVKYFQTADRPSKIGQKNYQLGASRSYHVVTDGGSGNANFQIPQVQWKTPPEFVLRSEWLVAIGEESKEIEVQKHREIRVLEAVYPRLSSIPPSPLVSSDVEGQSYDDIHTPIVTVIPIEERAAMDFSSSETAPSNLSIDSPPANLLQCSSTSAILNIPPCRSVSFPEASNSGTSASVISHGLESDPVIATAAAANAILKSKGSGSLIDTDLLIKFLKNPETTQKLINELLLSFITETGSSKLLIDKSDDDNSKPANAGGEAISGPLIQLSSSAPLKTGTVSGPMRIPLSVSLLRSSNDMLIKSSSSENNQPSANRGNITAAQTSEQLLAANTRMRTGSRPEHVMPSVARASSCDVLNQKCMTHQPISTVSQIVRKPGKQSLATSPQTGTLSQSKQVALSVSLSSSAPDLPRNKQTNEQGKLSNIGSVATLQPVSGSGSALKTGSASSTEHNPRTNTGNLVVPKPVVTKTGAADTDFGTGFRMKTETPLVSLPSSVHDFPVKKSKSEHNQQVNTEKLVASKPMSTQSAAVNTGTQSGFSTKTGIPPVSLTSLVHDLRGKISTSKHNQQVNTGNVVVPPPMLTHSVAANTKVGTGFSTKTGIPLVSLTSSVHDLPGKISTSEHNQQVNTGNVVVPQPVVTQSVAANSEIGRGFRIRRAAAPVSLLSLVHDFPSEKSTNEHNQQVDTGNAVVPRPWVIQSAAAYSGNGMGFRIKEVTPPQPFATPCPDIVGKESSNKQFQPGRTKSVAVPRPLMPSPAANSANGTGCRPIAVTPSVPFRSSVPDSCTNKPPRAPNQLATAVPGLVAENQPLHTPRVNVVAGPVAEDQPLSLSRIHAELLGTPNFGSSPVAKTMGPNLDVSGVKKLIDEHGAHVRGGNAPVAGINSTKPDWEMLRKMVSPQGSRKNLEIPLPGLGPLCAPSPALTFGGLAPSGENRQLQHVPASFPASLYAAPATLQLKDMQYHHSLIKQHNRQHELLQQNKPQNNLQGYLVPQNTQVVESEQKFHKPCLYYNTPNGCRNGSRCRFQHDLSKPWKSGGVLEAPSGKRMKPAGELTGET